MKVLEIASFMNPFSDALSAIFFLILLITSLGAVIWLLRSAKAECWENNWYGGDLDDISNDLDDEHGSINELSDAVATKAEKVAEMLPSMLLVFGLLGTFLGLGMALNNASNVLINANSTGMDGAMTQLMGMMEGLGAKFKTSTWGILCFIALSILFNALGFDEKRLQWVIKKVRKETEAKKTKLIKQQEEKDEKLMGALTLISKTTEESNKQLITSIGGFFDIVNDNQKSLIQEINRMFEVSNQTTQDNFQQHLKQMKANFLGFQNMEKAYSSSQERLINSIKENHDESISKNEILMSKLINGVEKNAKNFDQSSKESLKELKKIATYNQATQDAMQEFVDKTVQSMSSIGTSADKMAEAAEAVGSSAHELNDVVDNLQSELKSVMSTIKEDLGSTITHMGTSFKDNMDSMSKSMAIATNGISKSVSELSNSVNNTLNSVTKVIGESMDLQRKSADEFTVTSNTLNVQIFEMTDLVKQLSGDITSSLKSVAETSRRIGSLTNNFAEVTKSNEDLVQKMEEVVGETNTIVNMIVDTFEKVSGGNEQLIRNMNGIIQSSDSIVTIIKDSFEDLSSKNHKLNLTYETLIQNTLLTNQHLNQLAEWSNNNTQEVQHKANILNESLAKLARIEELSYQLVEINKKAS